MLIGVLLNCACIVEDGWEDENFQELRRRPGINKLEGEWVYRSLD